MQNTPSNSTTIGNFNSAVAAGYLTPVNFALPPTPVQAPVQSAVVTSKPAVQQTQQNVAYMNEQQRQANMAKGAADYQKAIAEQQALMAQSAKPATTSIVANDLMKGFVRTTNKEFLSAEEEMRVQEIKNISAQLENLATQMDQRTAQQIESIKKEYDQMSEAQKVANTRYEGGTETAGLVSGRARYAPEIQFGIQSNAVQSGIKALENIANKKNQLVAEIEQMRDERKYKLMNARIEELKTLNKESRLQAQQMVDNFYKEQAYFRENTEFVAKNLAPSVMGHLTGNPQEDSLVYEAVAKENGISPAALMRYVDEYKTSAKSKLPSSVQEYNFAVEQGYKGSYLDFERYGKSGGSGSGTSGVLSQSDVKAFGLPGYMVGMSKNEIIGSLSKSTVPTWFKELNTAQGGSDANVESLWNKYRSTPLFELNKTDSGDNLF